MGSAHIRLPKNFVLEERLERYADAMELTPAAYRGRWAEACWPLVSAGDCDGFGPRAATAAARADRYAAVHLDLGCGKAAYLLACAREHPTELFLGMDAEPVCVAYAAQHILESGLMNALVIPGEGGTLPRLFAPGELAGITINFPTPQPKRKHAALRLTYVDRLLAYRELLAPGAAVTLRTDSQPLYDWSLTQFAAAGYTPLWTSRDARAEHPELPRTEYEERLSAQGARICGICAMPGPAPSAAQVEAGRTAPRSLYDYLPDDLFASGYIPHGMGYAVDCFRARVAKGKVARKETGAATTARD